MIHRQPGQSTPTKMSSELPHIHMVKGCLGYPLNIASIYSVGPVAFAGQCPVNYAGGDSVAALDTG